MRISDWSSDVCSSDLRSTADVPYYRRRRHRPPAHRRSRDRVPRICQALGGRRRPFQRRYGVDALSQSGRTVPFDYNQRAKFAGKRLGRRQGIRNAPQRLEREELTLGEGTSSGEQQVEPPSTMHILEATLRLQKKKNRKQ